jgi:hypothetical protein
MLERAILVGDVLKNVIHNSKYRLLRARLG